MNSNEQEGYSVHEDENPTVQIEQEAIINPFNLVGLNDDESIRIVQAARQWNAHYVGYRWTYSQFDEIPLLGYYYGAYTPEKALDNVNRHGEYLLKQVSHFDNDLVQILQGEGDISVDDLMRLEAINTANMEYYRRKRANASSSRVFRQQLEDQICAPGHVVFKEDSGLLLEKIVYPKETSVIDDTRYAGDYLQNLLKGKQYPEASLQVDLLELAGHPLVRALVQDTLRTEPSCVRAYTKLAKQYRNLLVPNWD